MPGWESWATAFGFREKTNHWLGVREPTFLEQMVVQPAADPSARVEVEIDQQIATKDGFKGV